MKRLWKAGRRSDDLEGLLRAHSPSPHPEFIDGLAGRLSRQVPHPRAWSRIAFASALTTLMLGGFASFGALSYAAERVDHGVNAVKTVLGPPSGNAPRVSHRSPAADQYKSPPPTTPPAGGVLGSGGAGAAQVTGELPFTGFPLIVTAAIGFGFLVLGVMLRRRERPS